MSPWGKRASQFRSIVTNAQLELNYYHIKHSKHSPGYNWLLGIKCHICRSTCQNLTHLVHSLTCVIPNLSCSLRKCRDCGVCQLLSFTSVRQLPWDWPNGKSPLLFQGWTAHTYLSEMYTLCALNLLMKIYLSKTRRERNKSFYQSIQSNVEWWEVMFVQIWSNTQKKEVGRHLLLESQMLVFCNVNLRKPSLLWQESSLKAWCPGRQWLG